MESNFSDARQAVERTCPHCGGILLGREIPKFEDYERRVAARLGGRLPVSGEELVDVIDCKPFPSLTFQVKYSNCGYQRRGRKAHYTTRYWTWHQHKWSDELPDYYILAGVGLAGDEHWFVLRRQTFAEFSGCTKKNGDGGRILQSVTNRYRKNGSPPLLNRLFRHECKFDELAAEVQRQERLKDLTATAGVVP